jgi:hypothetical protein
MRHFGSKPALAGIGALAAFFLGILAAQVLGGGGKGDGSRPPAVSSTATSLTQTSGAQLVEGMPTQESRAGLEPSAPPPTAVATVAPAPTPAPTAGPPVAPSAPAPTPTSTGVLDAPNRLFVDPVGGSDNTTGRRDSPLRTLEQALRLARLVVGPPEIYVGGGDLGGPFDVDFAVRLFGGYDPVTWLPADNQESTMSAQDAPALAIAADDVTVEGFAIEVTGKSTFSSAVIVVNAANVVLAGNTIVAPEGKPGEPGANGLTGENGVSGGKGADYGLCPPDHLGGAGGSGIGARGGAGGTGGLFGGFDGTGGGSVNSQVRGGAGGKGVGYLASNTTAVNFGGKGDDGLSQRTAGAGGGVLGRLEGRFYFPADGATGESTRTHGAGGGGGGGGFGGPPAPLCGAGGGGGGGGGEAAKTDGRGGGGGGPSIAIIVGNSSLTLTENLIRTDLGGAGGPGGSGGRGGLGGPGGPQGLLAGGASIAAPGGAGGSGGDSAPGGGGGGGPSIGVLANASSTVSMSGNTFQLGSGGSGGAGGAAAQANGGAGGNGSKGLVAELYQFED